MESIRRYIAPAVALLCVLAVAAQSLGCAFATTSEVSVTGNSVSSEYASIDLYSDEGLENPLTSNAFSRGTAACTASGGSYTVAAGLPVVLSQSSLYLGCKTSYAETGLTVNVSLDDTAHGFFSSVVLKIDGTSYTPSEDSSVFTWELVSLESGRGYSISIEGVSAGGTYSQAPSFDVYFTLDRGSYTSVCSDMGNVISLQSSDIVVDDEDYPKIDVVGPEKEGTHDSYVISNSDGKDSNFISEGSTSAEVVFSTSHKFCLYLYVKSTGSSGMWTTTVSVDIGSTSPLELTINKNDPIFKNKNEAFAYVGISSGSLSLFTSLDGLGDGNWISSVGDVKISSTSNNAKIEVALKVILF